METKEIEVFLEEEQAKLDRADYLTKKLDSYWLPYFSPSWWKTRRELHKVVKSFRMEKALRNLLDASL